MLDDCERACATPNMTFSQRKTVLAPPPSLLPCSLSVTHLEHWSKQTRPPSSDRARAPPVKPFVKSSASPLPLSPSLSPSADSTYSHGIMRTAENIQGDSHVYEPTLLSRTRNDFSGSPPQHEIHKVKGRGWEPLLEVRTSKGNCCLFQKISASMHHPSTTT